MEENDLINESEQSIDYTELIEKEAFIGEYPVEVIEEGIKSQFDSYMSTEDRTDYVSIFYNELDHSTELAKNPEEYHPQEKMEVLNKIEEDFVSFLAKLFEERIAITLPDLEDGVFNHDEVEYQLRLLYDFFILNAPSTFRSVIVKDISFKLKSTSVEEAQLDEYIQEVLQDYSPLVLAVSPTEFLQYSGNDDVYDLFNDGIVVGNFLKKFTPRLYQNDEFVISLINDIIIEYATNKEV